MANNEALLTKQVAFHFRKNYPNLPFRVDIGADIPLPIRHRTKLKEIHGEIWNRGYPDMNIMVARGGYAGLFIELKATKTVIKTDHTDRQKWYHEQLRKQGYRVEFACGFPESKNLIDEYMSKKKTKLKRVKPKS